MRRSRFLLFVSLLIIILTGTGCITKLPRHTTAPRDQTVILVSFDGCRHDYPDSTFTPALDEMAKTGVRASLQTVFPSKTFPNHLTLVTGLYPAHHGIIANTIYDAQNDRWYKLSNGAPTDSSWYHGEPIWATAERQGIRTATFFWPGSEASFAGYRPTYWREYDGSVPFDERVSQVLKWLDLPPGERPRFISLYFEQPDKSGHAHGPQAAETLTAVRQVDSQLAKLWEGIKVRHLADGVNVIVVSDHGMTALSRDSVIFLDDYINMQDVQMIDWSPVAAIRPKAHKTDAVYLALKNAHPRLHVYRKGELPARYHYNDNAFIQPIIAVADLHWTITTRDYFDKNPKVATGGTHGYDPAYHDMDGIFYAAGPAVKHLKETESFQNLDVYNLMCRILHIKPAQNDGDDDISRKILKSE